MKAISLKATTALTLTLSPGEREQVAACSGYSGAGVANPAAGFRVRWETILPLLGERVGVRAGVQPLVSGFLTAS